MRTSTMVLLVAGLACLAPPGSCRADGPAAWDKVEYVLSFHFNEEAPEVVEKARQNTIRLLDPKTSWEVLDRIDRQYPGRIEDTGGLNVRYQRNMSGYTQAITKAVEAGELFNFSSDAQRKLCCSVVCQRLTDKVKKTAYLQKNIFRKVLEQYEKEVVYVPNSVPSIYMLLGIERDIRDLIRLETTPAAKKDPGWREQFEQTMRTNIVVTALDRKWYTQHSLQADLILADPEATHGLARLAGFYNRVVKDLGSNKNEEKIAAALDAWIIAPEEVKEDLMQYENLKKYLEDRAKYLTTYEEGLGDDTPKVRAFREEITKNEARLKTMRKAPIKLFPGAR